MFYSCTIINTHIGQNFSYYYASDKTFQEVFSFDLQRGLVANHTAFLYKASQQPG